MNVTANIKIARKYHLCIVIQSGKTNQIKSSNSKKITLIYGSIGSAGTILQFWNNIPLIIAFKGNISISFSCFILNDVNVTYFSWPYYFLLNISKIDNEIGAVILSIYYTTSMYKKLIYIFFHYSTLQDQNIVCLNPSRIHKDIQLQNHTIIFIPSFIILPFILNCFVLCVKHILQTLKS